MGQLRLYRVYLLKKVHIIFLNHSSCLLPDDKNNGGHYEKYIVLFYPRRRFGWYTEEVLGQYL